MFEIRTEIEIAAPARVVYAVLTDFATYPEWNPFVRSVEGQPQTGQTLQVCIQPPVGKALRFRPRVLVAQPARELRWRGHWLLPQLFAGEHSFSMDPLAVGGVRFVQSEQFSGLLAPLLQRRLEGSTRAGFLAFNEALKHRAEHA